jgi:hypothetical protein
MDIHAIRLVSIERARQYGIKDDFSPLPSVDEDHYVRSKKEIFLRTMCLNAVVSASFSSKVRSGVIAWVAFQGLTNYLSERETRFLNGQYLDTNFFTYQGESVYVLGWIMKFVEEVKIDEPVPMEILKKLPNLNSWQPLSDFREPESIRQPEEIYRELDFYYCVHWAAKSARLRNQRFKFPLSIAEIRERRRAFEWACSKEDWDTVPLDT